MHCFKTLRWTILKMLGFFHAYFSFFYSHQGKMGFGDTAQSTYAKLTISKSADKKFFSALNYEGIPVLKLGMDIIAMTLSVLRTLFFFILALQPIVGLYFAAL